MAIVPGSMVSRPPAHNGRSSWSQSKGSDVRLSKLDCNGSNFNEGRSLKLKWSTDHQSTKPFSMIPAATRTRTSRRWPSRWTTRSGASRLRPRVGPKRRFGRRSRGRSLTTFRLRASRFEKDLSHLKIRAKKQFMQQIYDVMMQENEHNVT